MSYIQMPVLLLLISLFGCKNDVSALKHPQKLAVAEVISLQNDFEDLNGNPVSLKDYRGKRVILNYWATWCRPCIEEMPAMVRAQEKLGKEGYAFLLVSDQSKEIIKNFKEKKQFDLTFIKYNGALADQQINALPASFMYDSLGKFQFRVDGAWEWDTPEVLQKLQQIP